MKWKSELMDKKMNGKFALRDDEFNYVLAELEFYQRIKQNQDNVRDNVEMSGVDGVWQSDSLLNRHRDLRQKYY
jgi:hypothetical protein